MRIVHLSDAHFVSDRSNAFNSNIVVPLIKDLEVFHKEKPIDLICFTGDLIDKGGSGNASVEFLQFSKLFIEQILTKLSLTSDRFLIIPGNHDIERGKAHRLIESQLQTLLIDRYSISKNMESFISDLNLERFSSYKNFQDNFYKQYKGYKANDFGYSMKLNINGKKIGVAGINSSWRCYDDSDRGRLIVGRKQIENIVSAFEDESIDIKIALMHHPYDHLIECDKDDIEGILTREFDILMTGHVHRSSSQMYQNSLGHGTIRSTAASNWDINIASDSIENCNGYTIIDFDEIMGKAILHNRKYSLNKLSYINNIDISEKDDGTTTFELPTDEIKKQVKRQVEIIDKIKSNYLPYLDEKLLIYNTDTNAPKKLESLFVLPNITLKKQELKENEEIIGDKRNKTGTNIDLEQLSLTNEHLLLLGDRESGKSTLLYRLLQHVINNTIELKRVPIYIDLKKSDLSIHVNNEMAKYLGIASDEVLGFLKTSKVLLLLDNLNFSKQQQKFINKLVQIIESNNNNIVVIATSESIGDGELPIEFLNNKFFKMCKVANIKHFQSNQIRSLMRKWFGLAENEILNDKFENIVRTFHSLNIPTTPMAVSMFLWIIEKQESYKPKNNAAMLQNFIEKILNKHSYSDIRLEDFDYLNQNRLLVHIAKKMFDENNINYRLDTFELKQMIQSHYKGGVGWTPKAIGKKPYYDWIPNYLISVGILVEEEYQGEIYVKFRLDCFFQYFLMQNIDIDENFRNYVFNEDHYLEFFTEIDYYTALYRDKTEALKRIVTLMNKTYENVIKSEKIADLLEGKDKRLDELFKKQRYDFAAQFTDETEIEEFVQGSKLTEEKEDRLNDILLSPDDSFSRQDNIQNKEPQTEYSNFKLLEKAWILGARVLRNSEESRESEYKREAYENVLIKSLTFMGVCYSLLNQFIKDEKTKSELYNEGVSSEFLDLIMKFFPTIYQISIFQNIGTSKLETIFKSYLDSIINNNDINLIHKFTALFIYTDLHPADERYYLDKMIPKQVNNVVKDFAFMKLNYYASANQKNNDILYPELMKKLIHHDVNKKYYPHNQSSQENTKHAIRKQQLLLNAKVKVSDKKQLAQTSKPKDFNPFVNN